MKIIKKLIATGIIMLSFNSTAGIISLDSLHKLNPLTLSESVESFYDYGGLDKWSSNTGFEKSNSIVTLLTKFNDNLSLVSLYDSTIGLTNDTSKGSTKVEMNGDRDLGSIMFSDDDNDVTYDNGNSWGGSFKWGNNYNDGMIYSFDENTPLNFSLDISYSEVVNIENFIFLSFDDNGNIEEYHLTDSSLNLSHSNSAVSVSESPSMYILILGLMLLLLQRKKQIIK